METKLVRLKPYNPKRNHVLKTYYYAGIKFENARGWYKVDAQLAEELSVLHQDHDNEDSPLAFDVCTEEQAKAIDEKEADAATVRKVAEKSIPVVDTTKGAGGGGKSSESSGEGDKSPEGDKGGEGGRRRGAKD